MQFQTLWPRPDIGVTKETQLAPPDTKLSANEETLHHNKTSGDVRQASIIMHTAHMAEQIWVLVQASSHLLAETLRRKM